MNTNIEIAVFGGGCFWCTEAVFKMLKGVISVMPGYSGGIKPNPTYDDVCGGNTGHAEVIRIEFDPEIVKFETLLTVFFATHDATTLNRQGNDVGTQYRSVIFYTNDRQKIDAEKFIEDINNSSKEGAKVVTEIKPLDTFYEAENYHQDYYARNQMQSYCQIIINPKLEKVQKKFADLIDINKQ